MTAQVLDPIAITDSMFTACSVSEPVPSSPLWVSGTTYAIGDVRSLVATGRQYTRRTAGAGTTAPNLDPTNWTDSNAEPVGMKWVTGTTYALNEKRLYGGRSYNRIVAGAGAVTPNLDTTNWADIGAAPSEIAWLATESYVIGDKVTRSTTHRVYATLVAGVDAGLPESTPARWFDAGPTNKWAAFDNYRSTATVTTGTLTATLKPGIITGLFFAGLVGDTLRVVCKNATSLAVYSDTTYSLSTYLTGDLMWEFYYGVPRQQDTLRIADLYPNDAQVEITLTASLTTGTAAIGVLALGSWNDIGSPQYGFKAQPIDYSRIKTDDYGNTTIIKGLAAKNLSGECVLMSLADAQAAVDVVYRLLGKPCAWVVGNSTSYDYLSAFGLGSADITAAGPSHANLSLTVKGLI